MLLLWCILIRIIVSWICINVIHSSNSIYIPLFVYIGCCLLTQAYMTCNTMLSFAIYFCLHSWSKQHHPCVFIKCINKTRGKCNFIVKVGNVSGKSRQVWDIKQIKAAYVWAFIKFQKKLVLAVLSESSNQKPSARNI